MSKKSSTFALAFEKNHGPLAQLNRVPHYGCGGCRFESCTDHTEKDRRIAVFFVVGCGDLDSGVLLGFRILETRNQVITLLFFGSEDIERRQVASFLVEVQSVAKYEFGGNRFANVFRFGVGELQRIGFE